MLYYDNYNLDEKMRNLKLLVEVSEIELLRFIGPVKSKAAGKRLRKNLRAIREMAHEMRKLSIMQTKDNEGEY